MTIIFLKNDIEIASLWQPAVWNCYGIRWHLCVIYIYWWNCEQKELMFLMIEGNTISFVYSTGPMYSATSSKRGVINGTLAWQRL